MPRTATNKKQLAKIEIPKRTKIGGQTIKVSSDAETELILTELGAAGACNPFEKVIYLLTTLDEEQDGEVYLHELIEFSNAFRTLELPHPTIQILAQDLHQALTSGRGKLR